VAGLPKDTETLLLVEILMNYYKTSDGRKVSQATIMRNLSISYQRYPEMHPCEACGGEATEHSHIISQARCKLLHKTELIWSRENWFFSCRSCHMEWEAIKGGRWINFNNVTRLLAVLKRHDPEGYEKRMQVINEMK
jgi:hypothetical protein